MQGARARAHADRERERASRKTTQGSKAGGGGERADANSEFARKYNLDDKELGTGAFSRVILATSNEGTKVAVKCISKNGELKQEDVDSLHEEVAVLRSVDHPNIVKLYDFFDEKRYYYMAIELMEGGELFERIVKKTFYNEMDARGLVRILLDALAYLHHRGIVHRDLKPENLLLKSPFNDFDIKLADFGFVRTPASVFSRGRGIARVLIRCRERASPPVRRRRDPRRRRGDDRTAAARVAAREGVSRPRRDAVDAPPTQAKKVEGKSLDTQCGTPGYVAPEILKGKKYGTAVDMWSCGVIVYILLGGYPPFHDDNHAILYRKIKAADYAFDIRVEIYIAKDPFVDLDAVEQMRQTEQTPRRWHGVDGASRAGSTRSTGTRCPMMRRT